jgi:hypothetical protein
MGKHLSAEEFARVAARIEKEKADKSLRDSVFALVDANRIKRGEKPQRGQRA